MNACRGRGTSEGSLPKSRSPPYKTASSMAREHRLLFLAKRVSRCGRTPSVYECTHSLILIPRGARSLQALRSACVVSAQLKRKYLPSL
eukprot:scaffold65709_cov74-Phaeocystis_antarctica.AAC.7